MPRPKNGLPRPAAHPRGKSGLLAEVGKKLYGDKGYVKGLGELCGVWDKTMRRWLDAESAIPDPVWDIVYDALTARVLRLTSLQQQVAPHAARGKK